MRGKTGGIGYLSSVERVEPANCRRFIGCDHSADWGEPCRTACGGLAAHHGGRGWSRIGCHGFQKGGIGQRHSDGHGNVA